MKENSSINDITRGAALHESERDTRVMIYPAEEKKQVSARQKPAELLTDLIVLMCTLNTTAHGYNGRYNDKHEADNNSANAIIKYVMYMYSISCG